MGKGGAVLGILGLLLGAGALGFAFIIWTNQNTLKSQLIEVAPQDMWYRYYEGIFEVDLQNTYLTIPNMSLSIDLTTQASIHLLFTCLAYTTGSPLGRSDLIINYFIDGLIVSNPIARVGTFYGNNTYYFHSVSLQHVIEGWTAGTHNISMYVRSTVTTNSLQYCVLTVESFPV